MLTDLATLAAQSGMSMEDVEILRSINGGQFDLGLSGSSTRLPNADMTAFSAGRPGLTAMPDGPARTPIGSAGTRTSSAVSQGMVDAAGLYGDLSGQFYDGMSRPARQAKAGAGRMIGRGGRKMAGNLGAKLSAVPGMAKVGAAAKVLAPGLGALGGALAVGDLVLGDESAANKTMDAAAMAAGGFLGSVGGPLGTAAGVGLGKMASDGIQYLFGDKKTPEQRRMEEALAALGGGRI